MSISEETIDLLNRTKDYIINRQYEEAYDEVECLTFLSKETGDYTAALLTAGINPLLFMSTIPQDYMGCYNADTVTIPGNITAIDGGAFKEANIQLLVLPSSIENINKWAFCYMRGTIKCNAAIAEKILQNCIYIDLIGFEVV